MKIVCTAGNLRPKEIRVIIFPPQRASGRRIQSVGDFALGQNEQNCDDNDEQRAERGVQDIFQVLGYVRNVRRERNEKCGKRNAQQRREGKYAFGNEANADDDARIGEQAPDEHAGKGELLKKRDIGKQTIEREIEGERAPYGGGLPERGALPQVYEQAAHGESARECVEDIRRGADYPAHLFNPLRLPFLFTENKAHDEAYDEHSAADADPHPLIDGQIQKRVHCDERNERKQQKCNQRNSALPAHADIISHSRALPQAENTKKRSRWIP